MFSIRQLYDLQLLDWEIQEREEKLDKVKYKIADDSELTVIASRITEFEARLDEFGKPRSQAENNIARLEQRLESINKRAYSGMITSHREMSAYEEEKASVEQNRAEEEDALLELLVTIEGLQAELEVARDSSEHIAKRRQKELTVLMASENSISAELPDLYKRRQHMISEVPPQTIAVYDNIRKVRGGHAVALVERGMCQACRISLPSTELQQARISQNIVRCDSCGRILVMT